MGKGGGKGGKGRVAKFIGLAAGIAFGFGGGAWGFLKAASVFSRVMYGLSLGMSIGGLFDKSPKQPSAPESTFDSKNNQVTSEGTIPIVYGQTKVGGLQTFHKMDIGGKRLDKDVVLCEGKINDIFGVTANGYLTSVQRLNETKQTRIPVFGIRNNKYPDAKVSVETGVAERHGFAGHKPNPSQQSIYQDNVDYGSFNKFKKLKLQANGKTVYIFLTDDNTTIDLQYSLACNTFGKIYQIILGDTYLSDLQTDGWELVNPVICQNSPSSLDTFGESPCYKRDVYCMTNGSQDGSNSTVYTHLGGKDQDAPDQYLTTGGYPNMAYVHADLRYTEKMGAGNPTVTAIVQGMIVYDWRDKQYKYSKNPVVCLYDYLTNKTYGAGRYVTPDILDMESFTDVANYCDEEITYNDPYGVTKTEPRYQLDICLNETKTHQENIQSILNSFLGFIVFSNNSIKLRCERLEQPVYAFNDDNIVEETLSYKSASIDQSPNKFNLTYVEPALDYTAVKLIVEDATNQLPPPIGIGRPVEQDIDFKGVRRQTQCLRLGKIARDIIRLCPITVTFKTGLMASHLEAGDIVTISKTYVDEDGVKQELFTNQQARITEIKEEDGTFEITARQYNPSIYDDTFGASLKVFGTVGNDKPIKLTPATVKPVDNIQFNQIYRGKVDGLPTYDIVLSFDEPDDVEFRSVSVYIQAISNGVAGEWKNYGESKGITTIMGLKRGDTINARIIPNDSKGIEHEESMSAPSYTVVSKFGTPEMPQNLRLKVTDEARITWDIIKNTDIDHYEISTTGLFNDGAVVSVDNEAPVTLTTRIGKIYVRGVNIDNVAGPANYVEYDFPQLNVPQLNYIKSQSGAFQVVLRDTPKTNPPILKTIFRVNDKDFRTDSNVFTYVDDPATYNVSFAYEDYFGTGAFSSGIGAVIKQNINQDLINRATAAIQSVEQMQANIDTINTRIQNAVTEQIQNSIGGAKLEITKAAEVIKQQITDAQHQMESTITQTASALDAKIRDIDSQVQSRVTQLASTIESSIKSLSGDEILSRINQSSGGTQIDGKLLHVTSDSVFDKGVVAKNIEAGTISTDKLMSSILDLQESGMQIKGGGVRIDASGIRMSNENGSFTALTKDGIKWYDSKGVAYSAIQQMVFGIANDGDHIDLNWDSEPMVFVVPQKMDLGQNMSAADDYLQGTMETKAVNVSKKGFDIHARITQYCNGEMYYGGRPWGRTNLDNFAPSRYSTGTLTNRVYIYSEADTYVSVEVPEVGVDVWTSLGKQYDSTNVEGAGWEYPPENSKKWLSPMASGKGKNVFTGSGHGSSFSGHYEFQQTKQWMIDYEKIPRKTIAIRLRKGQNVISCAIPAFAITPSNPWFKIANIQSLPEGTYFGIRSPEPVQWFAVNVPKENYFAASHTNYKTTKFTGRGTYTFTPTGKRFKITMIGASVASRGERPESSETRIVGNGIDYKTSDYATNLSLNNQQPYKQSFHSVHGDAKYNEKGCLYFMANAFKVGTDNVSTWGGDGLSMPCYVLAGNNVSFFNANFTNRRNLSGNPTEFLRFPDGNYQGRGDVNDDTKNLGVFGELVGCPSFTFTGGGGGNPSNYGRDMWWNIEWQMGLSKAVTYNVNVPTGASQYTITIGKCPDVTVGKEIHFPAGPYNDDGGSIRITNTQPFDGAVFITEEL